MTYSICWISDDEKLTGIRIKPKLFLIILGIEATYTPPRNINPMYREMSRYFPSSKKYDATIATSHRPPNLQNHGGSSENNFTKGLVSTIFMRPNDFYVPYHVTWFDLGFKQMIILPDTPKIPLNTYNAMWAGTMSFAELRKFDMSDI